MLINQEDAAGLVWVLLANSDLLASLQLTMLSFSVFSFNHRDRTGVIYVM